MTASRACTALVLSGGGARGAYQAGVMMGLRQLGVIQEKRQPFDIFVGTSAGSLNCTLLAAYTHLPLLGLLEMEQVWSQLHASQVFRTGISSMLANGLGWLRDLSLGGLLGKVSPRFLLDTAPFRRLLGRLPWARLGENLRAGHYRALGILATNYTTSSGVLFLQDQGRFDPWHKVRYRVEPAEISMEHVMASSAIPIIFPAVPIGGCYYGDGSLRNTAPLGPAIQLGARKIVAVGVREAGDNSPSPPPGTAPKLADVVGLLLDAVLLDAIEVDVQHCLRLNKLAAAQPGNFHPVDILWLRPSRNLAHLAQRSERRMPPLVRYLMRGLGDDQAIAELASYLIFEGEYCRSLMTAGLEDVLDRRQEVLEFFAD
jgi:NTE family protein